MNLVIHPEDATTRMLEVLYEGTEYVLITAPLPRRAMRRLLRESPQQERILLLGHGSAAGLLYREKQGTNEFSGLIISHGHAYPLRRHGANLVGIWCNAVNFARRERLHGLFSGMLITELEEAREHNVATSQEELARENVNLAKKLRLLLESDVPLRDIPALMEELDTVKTELTMFNYRNFFYV